MTFVLVTLITRSYELNQDLRLALPFCLLPAYSGQPLGAVHILRNTGWGGGLLQYYSFERKVEGYNPFSALI